MIQKNLMLFTRTPLHVGAMSSVGAIDLPIQRERHTHFPIIRGSGIKGPFADLWNDQLDANWARPKGSEIRWLFGSDDAHDACAGAVQFSEAKLLAFPVRSAKGCFAWITCPLILQRAERDGVIPASLIPSFSNGKNPDESAICNDNGTLTIPQEINKEKKSFVVLEEYAFEKIDTSLPPVLTEQFNQFMVGDPVWEDIEHRLVVISNGMMSYFTRSACEVAQHVKIDDETGTASDGALFNQENVPAETLFYSVTHFIGERNREKKKESLRKASEAFDEVNARLEAGNFICQFGGDSSTGLGLCSLRFLEPVGDAASSASTPESENAKKP